MLKFFQGGIDMPRSLGVACAMLVACAATGAAAAALPAVYSAQQAMDGQMVFTQNCASCHGNSLEGGVGPALVGQDFSSPADKNTVGSIFQFLSTQMPDGNGGSLSHTQYENVMSFILSKNGYPPGAAKLTYAAASASAVPLISQVK
jgi:mono/diheme cytochrome c family protein